MPDWHAVRDEFPALRHFTYLNTATFGQLPRRATLAVEGHFARRDAHACSDFLEWFSDADGIRERIATLIHCEAGDIAFFPNATTALSLLMNAIPWQAGDAVLTLEDEFPNHLYWGEVLAARGVIFNAVPWAQFAESITPRTRLLMLSTVNYTTGLYPPLEEVSALARRHNTLLYLDGTQSLGALAFDFQRIDPDMFAVDGYKWLLSPNGAGFAAIPPRTRKWLPPSLIGWRSDRRWREVNSLHHGAPEPAETAQRYEGGMLPFPSIYGMGASVELMLELGVHVIERRVLELAERLRSLLRRLDAELPSDRSPHHRSSIVCARWPGKDSAAVAATLRTKNVLAAARHGNLRLSAHFYNVEEDLDRLEEALREAL